MRTHILGLASACALFLTAPDLLLAGSEPVRVRVSATPAGAVELEVTGTIWFARHIDPVTGQGAATLVPVGGKIGDAEYPHGPNFPLDLRQLKGGIPEIFGPLTLKGTWSQEKRLVILSVRVAPRGQVGE